MGLRKGGAGYKSREPRIFPLLLGVVWTNRDSFVSFCKYGKTGGEGIDVNA